MLVSSFLRGASEQHRIQRNQIMTAASLRREGDKIEKNEMGWGM
jgi:hypothetical protein